MPGVLKNFCRSALNYLTRPKLNPYSGRVFVPASRAPSIAGRSVFSNNLLVITWK